MANSIIRQISREVFRAFIAGKYSVSVLGKTLRLESVLGNHWRVTDANGGDIGLRFDVCEKKCHFYLA